MMILKKPIITEKAMGQTAKQYYTFEVDRRANKHQIKTMVEQLFKVTVEQVRTRVKRGTQKRVGKMRRTIMTSPIKQALVKLAPNQTIDLFTVTEEAKGA